MVVIAVLIYIINVFLCLASLDVVKREKNRWILVHALFFMTMALLYVIWYYDSSWYFEAIVFTIGGVLIYGVKSNGSLREPRGIKSPFSLTFFALAMLLLTIIIRIVV
jgi:hypothetical protein